MSQSSDGNERHYYAFTMFQAKCSALYTWSHLILTNTFMKEVWLSGNDLSKLHCYYVKLEYQTSDSSAKTLNR